MAFTGSSKHKNVAVEWASLLLDIRDRGSDLKLLDFLHCFQTKTGLLT
jgi:hypothetical protein